MFEEDSENEEIDLFNNLNFNAIDNQFQDQQVDFGLVKFDRSAPRIFTCLGSNFKFNSEFHDDGLVKGDEVDFLRQICKSTSGYANRSIESIDDDSSRFSADDERILMVSVLKLKEIGQNVRRMMHANESNQGMFLSFRKDAVRHLVNLRDALARNLFNFENLSEVLLMDMDRFLSSITVSEIVDLAGELDLEQHRTATLNSNHHLFHNFLEMQWFCLTNKNLLMHIDNNANKSNCTSILADNEDLNGFLVNILENLIYLAAESFSRITLGDLRTASPFTCMCVKELWLLLQFFFENNNLDFWQVFNSTIVNFVDNPLGQFPVLAKDNDQKDVFILWVMSNVAQLHGYNSQGVYLGSKSGRVFDNGEVFTYHVTQAMGVFSDKNDEMAMRVLMYFTGSTMIDLWPPRLEILIHFWEYFHKRINSIFMIKDLAEVSVMPANASDFLTQIRSRLQTESLEEFLQRQPNCTSYSLFLKFLGYFIKDSLNNDKIKQWDRLKGRIFSKFPTNRFDFLNESGLYNVLSLYFTMALTANLEEIGNEMESIFEHLYNLNRESRNSLVLSGHLALLILYVENKMNITICVAPIVQLIKRMQQSTLTATTSECYELILDGMRNIFSINQPFIYGQDVLIGTWLGKCLQITGLSSLKTQIYDLLNQIIEKIISLLQSKTSSNNCKKMTENLFEFILPFVRRNFENDNVVRVAVLFTRLSLNDETTAKIYNNDFLSLITYYLLETSIDFSKDYLTQLLVEEPRFHDFTRACFSSKNDAGFVIVQCWIQICIFSRCLNCRQLGEITKFVMNLSMFDGVLSDAFRKKGVNVDSSDVICEFFEEMGQKFLRIQDPKEMIELRLMVSRCLSKFERKLDALLRTTPSSGDLIRWVYLATGKLIYFCAPLVYSQINLNLKSSIVKVIVSKMLLPSALYRGKRLHVFYVDAIRHSWHLYVVGIFRLIDQKTVENADKFPESTIHDLIVQYIKYFEMKPREVQPFVAIFQEPFFNEKLGLIVLQKISSDILERKSEHVEIVMSILPEIFHSIVDNEDQLVVFLDGILRGLFLQIIIHGTRRSVVDLIEAIIDVLPRNFEASDKFAEVVLKVIESQRGLNVNQQNNFEMFLSLISEKTPIFVLNQIVPRLADFNDLTQMAFSQDDSPFRKSIILFEQSCTSRR